MPVINGKYYTEDEIATIKRAIDNDDDFDKFLISGVIGAVTDSALLGGLLGGSLLGGLLGNGLDGDIFDD